MAFDMKNKNHLDESRQIYLLVFPQIIELLRLLASPFEVQVSVFPDNEFPPDEIADEIDYKCFVSETLFKNNFISTAQYNNIKTISEKTKSFCKEEWSIEAMGKSSDWVYIRALASDALKEFGVEYTKPNLYWYPITE